MQANKGWLSDLLTRASRGWDTVALRLGRRPDRAPGGGHFAGALREINEDDALFDFNHLLASRTLKFEAKIFGIL